MRFQNISCSSKYSNQFQHILYINNKLTRLHFNFCLDIPADVLTQQKKIKIQLSKMLDASPDAVSDQPHPIRHDRGSHRRRGRRKKWKQDDYLQIDPGFKPIMKAKNRAIKKARFKVRKEHLLGYTPVLDQP